MTTTAKFPKWKIALPIIGMTLLIASIGFNFTPSLGVTVKPNGDTKITIDVSTVKDPFCISSIDFSEDPTFTKASYNFVVGPSNFRKDSIDLKLPGTPFDKSGKQVRTIYSRLAVDCLESPNLVRTPSASPKIYSRTVPVDLSKLSVRNKSDVETFLKSLTGRSLIVALKKVRNSFQSSLPPYSGTATKPEITHDLRKKAFKAGQDIIFRLGAVGKKPVAFDWRIFAADGRQTIINNSVLGQEIISDSQGSTVILRAAVLDLSRFYDSEIQATAINNAAGRTASLRAKISKLNDQPEIKVLSPIGEEKVRQGSILPIKWESANLPKGSIFTLHIVEEDSDYSPIDPLTDRLDLVNSFDYKVGSLPAGSYRVAVFAYTEQAYNRTKVAIGFSKPFMVEKSATPTAKATSTYSPTVTPIVQCTPPPPCKDGSRPICPLPEGCVGGCGYKCVDPIAATIKVIAPTKGAIFEAGQDTLPVRWEATNIPEGTRFIARFVLVESEYSPFDPFNSGNLDHNARSLDYVISKYQMPGTFRVGIFAIQEVNNQGIQIAKAFSEPIVITNPTITPTPVSITATPTHTPTPLAPSLVTLRIKKAGLGMGSVFSTTGEFNCEANQQECVKTYPFGQNVYLFAPPSAGSVLGGWSHCAGTPGNCNIPMTQNQDVTVTFNPDTTPKGTVTVLSPNGGETLYAGKTYNITWMGESVPATSKFAITLHSGLGQVGIIASAAVLNNSNFRSFLWTPAWTGKYSIRVIEILASGAYGGSDYSNAEFTVSTPPIN